MTLHLSLAQARLLHLAAQGLLQPARRKATSADVLAATGQIGLLAGLDVLPLEDQRMVG